MRMDAYRRVNNIVFFRDLQRTQTSFYRTSYIYDPVEYANVGMVSVREMYQNDKEAYLFPNPVESGCTIEIQTANIRDLSIDILDLQGRMIRKVFMGRKIPMSNIIVWDGNTESGKPANPGLYFIRIREDFKTRYFRVIKTGK